MTDTLPSAAVGRELGGCPVMHRDFSRRAGRRDATGSRPTSCARRARVFFNTFAQGYWVFTRHDAVRDIYKTPGPVLQRVDHAVGARPDLPVRADPDRPARPHQVPAHPQPVVLARARWTRPSRGRATSAAASSRTWPPTGGCDFVTEFALRFPTEAFLSVIGVDPADADLFVPWVEDFFAGFGGDPAGLRADGRRRSRASASTGSPRWTSARGEPEPRTGDLASHLLHATFDDAPADRRRDARHADRARPGRTGHDARRARLHVPAPRRPTPSTAGA